MKTLTLGVDIEGLRFTDENLKNKTPVELMTDTIENVILTYAMQKQGLAEDERRMYYKIHDIFSAATTTTVELDDAYVGFIRKCFRESKLMPTLLLERVEKRLAEIQDR
jgi:hypothetical protein